MRRYGRHPRADELAPALVTAFAHPSYEIQRRAVQLTLKLLCTEQADTLAGRFSNVARS
jgi:hypothetical protein